MREDFDSLVKEATAHITVQYKKDFQDIQEESEKLKEEVDKLTREFLEAKITNYFK